MKRILVLQSVNDRITAERIEYSRTRPVLKSYEIQHIFAVELTTVQQRLSPGQMMREVEGHPFDSASLQDRLDKKIEFFKPDLLLIHVGFAFHAFTKEILGILKLTKQNHPTLTLALEGSGYMRLERLDTENKYADLFADSDEIRAVSENLF